MKLPDDFLASLEGTPGFDREAFVAVHEKGEGITSIRLNGAKQMANGEGMEPGNTPLTSRYSPVPWCRDGRYFEERPSFTFDPLFHAGLYYVQEASSMFLERALAQLADLSQPLKVLDLCAAPGGKSTHLQSLLPPESLLVSNEIIKQRCVVLTDNIIKWGCSNVFVTNNDAKAFQNTPGFFDVMVVDAPCSGSGLFRKDADAISEWSLHNVNLCSQRQQRILTDALPSLKEGGLLIYSTCSYSEKEDETIVDWLVQELDMENVPLQVSENGIVVTVSPLTASTGYRFYPDKVKGEGFFLSCFRKKNKTEMVRAKQAKPEMASANEKNALAPWIALDNVEVVRFKGALSAVPKNLLADFMVLQPVLNLHYVGVGLGEVLKNRLVPQHALAQSLLLLPGVPATELAYDDAIKYLQRQDFLQVPQAPGWQLVCFQHQALGWINALQNRVNNYYPKEIRILKQYNTPFAK